MTSSSDAPRRSIKEPIPAIFEAWALLSEAADAHLAGKTDRAEYLFRQANIPEVWYWTNPAWGRPDLNIRIRKPTGDTHDVPKAERDLRRDIRHRDATSIRAAVLARDGYRCRYCGIPVIDADIRRIVHEHYPDAVPWEGDDVRTQHAAFQCFWLQYDHVVPHSHGGRSSEDNVVVSCALCNFGKDKYTLKQLDISDPRLRPPESVSWDGLERLRIAGGPVGRQRKTLPSRISAQDEADQNTVALTPIAPSLHAFFLPGAWLSGGYVFTPVISGKERWFKVSPDLIAETVTRDGVSGCVVRCAPAVLRRRGLSPEDFIDREQQR